MHHDQNTGKAKKCKFSQTNANVKKYGEFVNFAKIEGKL